MLSRVIETNCSRCGSAIPAPYVVGVRYTTTQRGESSSPSANDLGAEATDQRGGGDRGGLRPQHVRPETDRRQPRIALLVAPPALRPDQHDRVVERRRPTARVRERGARQRRGVLEGEQVADLGQPRPPG